MHPRPDEMSYHDWMGTDLTGRHIGRPPHAGPHQGLPGRPIDRPSPEEIPDSPEPIEPPSDVPSAA